MNEERIAEIRAGRGMSRSEALKEARKRWPGHGTVRAFPSGYHGAWKFRVGFLRAGNAIDPVCWLGQGDSLEAAFAACDRRRNK